ncbi:hypothetical protein CCACVL1_17180 [Corchorus capsularis]|uniref:Uncharacterized protein n=1 Tax=Corchorus capsularis TaxID=210143 RepID=A0A1R3HTJ3_COCAP|nr:hypothetical protein CCACVL1_17180 [Corchorus capsularis]
MEKCEAKRSVLEWFPPWKKNKGS